MHEPITVDVNEDAHGREHHDPDRRATGTDEGSIAALATAPREIVPETVGALPDAEAGVTGISAQWKDSRTR